MKKNIKIILIILIVIFGILLLDTIQAKIFKNSPFISWEEKLDDNDSWVDKGILIDTYYCTKEKDIVTVSWHLKGSKFTCPIDNKESNYDSYNNVSTLTSENVDTKTLIMFDGILYGKSYKMIDYAGGSEAIGFINKLIANEYIPKLDGETNTEEILSALVFDKTNNSVVLSYNNQFVLFEKIEP